MIVNIYLLGSMITMIAAVFIGHADRPWATLAAALVAAALWPVLVIGGIQLLAVSLLADQHRHAHTGALVAADNPLHRLIRR